MFYFMKKSIVFSSLIKTAFFLNIEKHQQHQQLQQQHYYEVPTSLNPGGIRTRIVCSSGGRNDHRATPLVDSVQLEMLFLASLGWLIVLSRVTG
jgi:hypothetical protein